MSFRSCFLFAACCFILTGICAQEFVYKHYTTDDGLPTNNLYFIHQDKMGFYWIASERGLIRFDGYNFLNFKKQHELPYQNIFEIKENNNGDLWLRGYSKHLVKLNQNSVHIFDFDTLQKPNSRYIRAFQFDENNSELNNLGLIKSIVDARSGLLVAPDSTYTNIELNAVNAQLKIDQQEQYAFLCFGKDTMLSKLICRSSAINTQFYSCLRTRNKEILISHYNHLFVIKQKKIALVKKFTKTIENIFESPDGHLFISFLEGGVTEFSNINLTDSVAKHYLPDRRITSAMIDANNGRWFSTLSNGLYYLPWDFIISYPYNEKKIYGNEPIKAIPNINHEGTLNLTFFTKNGNVNQLVNGEIRKGINFNQEVRHVHSDPNGSNWVTLEKKIVRINDLTINKYTSVLIGAKLFAIPGHHQNLWIGGYTGVSLYNLSTFDSLTSYLNQHKINHVNATPQGTFIAGFKGLWKWTADSLEYLGNKHPLLQSRIDKIIYRDGALYLSTRGKGLLVMQADSLIQFSVNEGLKDSVINSLYIDSQHHIWVGTSKGVDCILNFPQQKTHLPKIASISKDDGLLSNNIKHINEWNDQLIICSDKGLSHFNINRWKDAQETNIPLYLLGVTVNDSLHFEPSDSIVLAAENNTISIQYLGVNPREKNHLVYRYRLSGIDENWVQTTTTQVRFPDLPPGNYQFDVQVKGRNGAWKNNLTPLVINIKTPWYLSWWFKGFMLITLSLFIWFVMQYRINQIKNKNNLHEQLNSARMQALKAQMNPHFIFNSLNSIQRFIMENNRESASIYLSRFAMLTRKTLDFSQKDIISLEEEISLLKTYVQLEQLRFSHSFEFTIHVNPELDRSSVGMPPLVLQPFLENAIWHGLMPSKKAHKKLELLITQQHGELLIRIIDNGIGRSASLALKKQHYKQSSSKGISISENRLQLLEKQYDSHVSLNIKDLYSDQNQAEGTEVEIRLPLIFYYDSNDFN